MGGVPREHQRRETLATTDLPRGAPSIRVSMVFRPSFDFLNLNYFRIFKCGTRPNYLLHFHASYDRARLRFEKNSNAYFHGRSPGSILFRFRVQSVKSLTKARNPRTKMDAKTVQPKIWPIVVLVK